MNLAHTYPCTRIRRWVERSNDTETLLAVAGKQAKILSVGDVNDLLVFASCTRHPLRNRVIVLLAAKAGLRAGEIALPGSFPEIVSAHSDEAALTERA